MRRLWYFLTSRTTLTVLGLLAVAGIFLFDSGVNLQLGFYAGIALVTLLTLLSFWLIVLIYRHLKAKPFAYKLGLAFKRGLTKADTGKDTAYSGVDVLRNRLLEAIKTLESSKLGFFSKASALYELPWYMIIGNPAAGKSSAIANSGLQFPFAEKAGKSVHGVGGTRNCDWFFTSEGILLDTAGRYTAHEEDREEWLGFLQLLKKHRPLAPINGILIAASITELTGNNPEFAINLAKTFRERIQELTEKLEIMPPVYLIFTKADTLAGFNEFFQDVEQAERDRVWGATIPYNPEQSGQDIVKFFDQHFDELYEGLKQLSLAKMSVKHGGEMETGIFTFPLEFLSLKNALLAFITTLFEDNPFQFKPVFRGFYFTSAVQDRVPVSASSERVALRFGLNLLAPKAKDTASRQGYFLRDLFRKVIFADKNLVAQFTSRAKTRIRYAAFFGSAVTFGFCLAAWSWSYLSNLQLTENVQADLDKIVKLQNSQFDLQSRLESLEILQERLRQLENYRHGRPLALDFGLYQGDEIRQKLSEEYFAGIKAVLLKPVAENLERFLSQADLNGTKNQAGKAEYSGVYKGLSPADSEDVYNALKTYLMLSDRTRAEAGHLNDQIARFWRTWLEANRGKMPRDDLIKSAENIISFYLAHISDPNWPVLAAKTALIEQSRDVLSHAISGLPARDRVYADIKTRASTRFSAVTVASITGEQDKTIVAGSYAVPGIFTKAAWEGFIAGAFKEAANHELKSTDWVLNTARRDDLTLEGSPEQIEKALIDLYKTEYSKEWQKFLQGVVISNFNNFGSAVSALNRLGDPQSSPVIKLVDAVYEQTSWDNPSLVNEGLQRAHKGFISWFKETLLRQKPSQVDVNLQVNAPRTGIPMGPVGRDFSGIAKLVVVKDKDTSLLKQYLMHLSALRARFNQLNTQGDTGPGAIQLMKQTLDGNGSELAETLKFVDEHMLTGMPDNQKQAIRPLLVRPLMQAFEVVIKPVTAEINKTWQAQVYAPFQVKLAGKYPFAANARIEANQADIAELFGGEGAIARFFDTTMGSLVIRRGDSLTVRTWAGLGVVLSPAVLNGFAGWVAPLSSGGVAAAAPSSSSQWVFQMQALPSPGTLEYTLEIDGQKLRYRNTEAHWMDFVWPNSQGVPGARVTATNYQGRIVEVVNFPGKFGFKRLIDAAQKNKRPDGVFELNWANRDVSISANLKIISKPDSGSDAAGAPQAAGYHGLNLPETVLSTALSTAQGG